MNMKLHDLIQNTENVTRLSILSGFIDGTVLKFARPGDNAVQNSAYNGHKRKHALKYQTITPSNGLISHASGPL